MKIRLSYKHIFLETLLILSFSFIFSLFAKDFHFWLVISLILALIWHHRNEFKLLEILYPKAKAKSQRSLLEYLSPTQAYWERKNRKEKIKTLRLLSKLNKNIKYLPDGVIICQQNGEINWCNNTAQEIFSFYWHKKTHKNIFNVIFYPEFKTYFHHHIDQHPLVLFTTDQRYIEINLNLYDSSKYLVIMRDVTQIIRLLHTRQTFLSNVNHELRTPLTVLQGYLEFLDENMKNEPYYKKPLQTMLEQTHRMAHLLEQLSLLAKIEQSNKPHYPVNLSNILDSIKKNLAILGDNSQKITFEITPNLQVLGDEGQLQSATSNLIYNAIQHSGKHANIHISWKPCEEGAKFCVSDDGIGIAEKHLPHLTERFYRVDESRNKQTGGSGLGLAIVKHALEQHHSTLLIESEQGKGSCFSFIIKNRYLVK
ncbi:phosphate regulon sensor histidine kinase PhoR [Avibacterium sp. 21-599]|uniref:phosphate regulon sensor histidine kinase PhoR n=1 Tax=Avibacterium sp. 21-599 TaxID=2911528 RepID=UPI0022465C5C|nr:phosphate regulon sensor histidine kinase PhoR [Avibacterium sp. 21-599]MCW9717933.1 phosphate regulon sensor histidine kinase PhoR [Avibacterium sp. 21-599]